GLCTAQLSASFWRLESRRVPQQAGCLGGGGNSRPRRGSEHQLQPHAPVGRCTHFCPTPGHSPPQAPAAPPVHRRSGGTQSQLVELVATPVIWGGQLPPHSPAAFGDLHSGSVVVVLFGVVVVVVEDTTSFDTGAHSSCGRPTFRFTSRPN